MISLQIIIRATGSEFEAFLAHQAEEHEPSRDDNNRIPLIPAERRYARRADRLAYHLANLNRLMMVQRQVSRSSSITRSLESEIVQGLNDAEAAAVVLRQIRRTRLSTAVTRTRP